MRRRILTLAAVVTAGAALALWNADASGINLGGVGLGDVGKLVEVGKKTKHAMDATDLTAEQEYYLGRSVSANILGAYKLYENPEAVTYVNTVGAVVVRSSDRPELFKGYRFGILDSDEINGLSAPGGFVFVTRGLLRCCRDESALAAILAHEVSHIVYQHGLRSIRANRMSPVAGILLGEAASRAGAGGAMSLLSTFTGSIDDMTGQLIKGKYSRETEDKADEHAYEILRRIGYAPASFLTVLQELDKAASAKGEKKGFTKSHPDPKWRIRTLEQRMRDIPFTPAPTTPERDSRFAAAMGGM